MATPLLNMLCYRLSMNTGHIIAVGGGLGLDSDGCSQFNQWLLEQTNTKNPRVLYIPTASGDSPQRVMAFHRILAELGCRGDALSLFNQQSRNLREDILSYDLIYVGGGNTANMMAIWDVHGLRSILREACEQGILLSGKSAGSLCWFEGGLTDSFGPELGPIKSTLGFLAGSYVPHYNEQDYLRHRKYARLVADGTLPPGFGAPDGVTLHFINGDLVEVVAEQKELRAFHLSPETAAEGGKRIAPYRIIERDSYRETEFPPSRRFR